MRCKDILLVWGFISSDSELYLYFQVRAGKSSYQDLTLNSIHNYFAIFFCILIDWFQYDEGVKHKKMSSDCDQKV